MKSRDILASIVLIGAAVWIAATIFMSPADGDNELELYGWLFQQRDEAERAEAADAAPVRVYETPKALGDRLWSILMPKEEQARFTGTGGALSLLPVSTGAGTGAGKGNALLTSQEFRAAADGAISGTQEGIAALLAYLDAAGGNETIIAFRVQLLLEALAKDSRMTGSLTALQEATTNISEAAFTALWSGYIMPANFQPDFYVPPGTIGYDLGPVMLPDGQINPVYENFLRVPADSDHVEGIGIDVETSPQLLWGDGVRGLTAFTAPIPNGTYKVYVLTSKEGGIEPTDAFGDYNTLRRDKPLRRVDLRERHAELEAWIAQHCAGARPAVLGAAGADCQLPPHLSPVAEALMSSQGISAEIEPETALVSLTDDQTRGLGSVYALREEVKNGQLFIDFNQGSVPSYVVGIVVVAIDDSFGAQMSAMISAVLETVHPASGEGSQGPGLATNFAATTLPNPGGGGGGAGTGGGGAPGGLPNVDPGPSGDGDGDGGDGDGDGDGGGDGDGDGGGPTAQLVAEGLGPYTGFFGDELTLDGTQSTFNGELILSVVDNPADLLVEWLFDLDGDGSYETLISNDLVALIDSTVFGSTGQFQGILRLTYQGLVSIDQVLVILLGENGGTVPEPGILLLLALAIALLLGLHYLARRRTG
jgi:hypothetical protein